MIRPGIVFTSSHEHVGQCRVCAKPIPEGQRLIYESTDLELAHLACVDGPAT
jgi:hypothetical protein